MRISDWSSDVCSSDLGQVADPMGLGHLVADHHPVAGGGRVEDRKLDAAHRVPDVDEGTGLAARAVDGEGIADRRLHQEAVEQIGRASCRESVCQYVSISVVAVSLKNKKNHNNS